MKETWRPVLGFEGLYDVSNQGRVASWIAIGRPKAVPRRLYERRIRSAPPRKRDGYRVVSLAKNGSSFVRAVHRLVCEAFHGPRPNGAVVRHIDGNKLNNISSNLIWGTPTENNADLLRHGRHNNGSKTHCKGGHSLDGSNLYINATSGARQCRECQSRAKRKYANKVST